MSTQNFDVIIIGAGLSGIGMACRLQRECPTRSYAILEARDSIGGTWDLYRYPGIRSDTDMTTMAYDFRPFYTPKMTAPGEDVRKYINDTAKEYQVVDHIRFSKTVKSASWSSTDNMWTLHVTDKRNSETYRCGVLISCSGYYSYSHPHRPEFDNQSAFKGEVIHPQFWPEDLDTSGKKIIVIGSGATAASLVPKLAANAKKVTMVQRSPTYYCIVPVNETITKLFRFFLPRRVIYQIVRAKNRFLQLFLYRLTQTLPGFSKKLLVSLTGFFLGKKVSVKKHFTPKYLPWAQRLCLLPGGDLLRSIATKKVTIVTDSINKFTRKGLMISSGQELEADIIVTATGLTLKYLGGVGFSVDGQNVDFSKEWTYRGMMVSNVPNFIHIFGFISASWTLRSDMISRYACRLIKYMGEKSYTQVVPKLRDQDQNMKPRPYIDGFNPGYIERGIKEQPRQGDHMPWVNTQNYHKDLKVIKKGPVNDGVLRYSSDPVSVTNKVGPTSLVT